MPTVSSLFTKASSSKRGFLSPSRNELPRWRTPSPMTASIVPPPIVQSTYAPSPPKPTAQSIYVEPSTPQQDRQRDLEADLQYLLDAQAEGLVKGLENGVQDDATSTGSTTPTARSVRSSSSRRPAVSPLKKKLGLRSARKGLYNTMLALSAVKDDELADIADNLREEDERLERIDNWEQKRAGLQEKVKEVDSTDNEATMRAQKLRQQAEGVEIEIHDLERQLEDRRVLHRKLMRQVSAVENEVQAKMASYTTSLRMLEEDVRKFLSIAPAEAKNGINGLHNGGVDPRQSIWHLPPQRRTLELAREEFTHSRAATFSQQSSISREKSALDEGAVIWRDVVAGVTNFEKRMRDDMRSPPPDGNEGMTRLRDLLGHLDVLVETLEANFADVKGKGWNLLVAAIGAEIDALKRGKEMLQDVLGLESTDLEGVREGDEEKLIEPERLPSPAEKEESPRPATADSSPDEELRGLDRSFEAARRRKKDGRASNGVGIGVGVGGDSDDEPDPELLFSQRHSGDE